MKIPTTPLEPPFDEVLVRPTQRRLIPSARKVLEVIQADGLSWTDFACIHDIIKQVMDRQPINLRLSPKGSEQ